MRVKYSDEAIKSAVTQCTSVAGVLRLLGASTVHGGMATHMSRRIRALHLDTSHFCPHNKGVRTGKFANNRKKWQDILVLGHPGTRGLAAAFRAIAADVAACE